MNTKKRNYAAERKQAADYADKIMEGKRDVKPWVLCWDLAYHGYLAGLRAAQRR